MKNQDLEAKLIRNYIPEKEEKWLV